MKLVVTSEQFKQMPYSGTEVSRAKTFGEVIGLLEAYGIKDYDWKKRKATPPFTVSEETLVFPIEFKRGDGSNASVLVRIDVPQIYEEKKIKYSTKTATEYKEACSWRLFWWYMKARLEAAFYGISSLEQEFLYQITDESGSRKLGEVLMPAIREGGLNAMLEDKREAPRRVGESIEVEGEVGGSTL
jgi:hypothetical protein